MNSDAPQPSFELPPVHGEGEYEAVQYENTVPRPEVNTAPQQALPSQPAPVSTQASLPSPVPVAVPQQQSLGGTVAPTTADDNDLIEEEWISKAKQIVAATKDDPYRQSIELSRFKADYLRKRYNKDLRVEES